MTVCKHAALVGVMLTSFSPPEGLWVVEIRASVVIQVIVNELLLMNSRLLCRMCRLQ